MENEFSLLSADDLHLFNEGTHHRLYRKLGAHVCTLNGTDGVHFAVWAPNAERVCLMGDFNGWDKESLSMRQKEHSGIWEIFVPGLGQGSLYKYHVVSRYRGYRVDKSDPFAFATEPPPKKASAVWNLDYQWGDSAWMSRRRDANGLDRPASIYEVHPGSWRRVPEEGGRPLSYRELGLQLAEYVSQMGFTHVEFLPVMEHPFYGSWGYQTTGHFAPTSRYGSPQDFMWLIDHLHQNGIGVILDWVPSHFPTDEHGLGFFDGTHLFEHSDPRQGKHRDWDTLVFNYGRHEIRSFIISSALFWLDKYHVDGLRIDAVASMLYLDYSREEGEWVPNKFGGRENLEAIELLRDLNRQIYEYYPDVQTHAEESTAWPMVSRPTYVGGLGFGLKWDMGWMHDTLDYMSKNPIHRRFHHDQLTFRGMYQFSENFVLPLSHDEVVYGKGSLLDRMPGDYWQKFANLRLLLGYMYTQPGKKLLFMGGEFGQWSEWYHETSLDWNLLEYPAHRGLQQWVRDLNQAYRDEAALHVFDCHPGGFEWIDCHDAESSTLSYFRKSDAANQGVLVLCNFTPVPREPYSVGAPYPGYWREILNSDAPEYGGSGLGNLGGVHTVPAPCHGRPQSFSLLLPPLGMVCLKYEGSEP
jgi:1,4-alpha-glucan branching enzyme